MIEVKESFKINMWGEYVCQLIRRLIRFVFFVEERELVRAQGSLP